MDNFNYGYLTLGVQVFNIPLQFWISDKMSTTFEGVPRRVHLISYKYSKHD